MSRTKYTDRQRLYITSITLLPYGRYDLYRELVPVEYSYNPTLPMGRTACTVPKCLYGTAVPLTPVWALQISHSPIICKIQLHLY